MKSSAACLLACYCFLHALTVGSCQNLGVRFPGSSEFFSDPSNISVGSVVDLAVQVECASTDDSSDSESYEWTHGNGTEILEGLESFGISQGMGGVLRVYPADLLKTGNEFICSSVNGNASLNVTFILEGHPFFILTIPLRTDDLEDVRDLCVLPDIPMATVTVMSNSSSNTSYCAVQTERGNFRSTSILISMDQNISGSTANITLDGSPERVFYGATSLTFSVGCEEGQLFKNGSLEERRIFNRSDENETGIYQCISTPDETATDLLYVAVAFVRPPNVTPTSINVLLGSNNTVIDVMCTVIGNPVPTVNWMSANLSLTQPRLPAAGFMEPITSVLSVDVSDLSIGQYTVTCQASQTAEMEISDVSVFSSDAVITVSVDFSNLMIQANPLSLVLGSSPDVVNVTCMVESSFSDLSINFSWRNGEALPGKDVIFVGGGVYQSSSSINVSALNISNETVTCTSSLNISNGPPPLTASVDLEVSAIFENISIFNSSDSFTLGSGSDVVTITCYVTSARLPQFAFFLDGEMLEDPSTNLASDGSGILFFSSVSLNTTDLNSVGTKNISCQATLASYSLTASLMILVDSIFNNVSLVDSAGGKFVLSEPLNGSLTLNCSVESSQPPEFAWMRNNNSVVGGVAMPVVDGRYASVLVIDETELLTPREEFVCTATVNVLGRGLLTSRACAGVEVSVDLTNIVVDPSDSRVNLTIAQVGGQMGMVNLTCRLAASLAPDISWTRLDARGGAVEVEGSDAALETSGVYWSQLLVNASEFRGNATFTCTASVRGRQFNGSINAAAVVVTQVFPEIVTNLTERFVAVAGDNVTLSCSAEGFPSPQITWVTGNDSTPIVNASTFTISSNTSYASTSSSDITTSVLVFAADSDGTENTTSFACVAENSLGVTPESNRTLLLVAGPPLPPQPMAGNMTSSSVILSWSEPFSLVDVTGYNLSVILLASNSSQDFEPAMEEVGGDQTSFDVSFLLPFSRYQVFLQAFSRGGASELGNVTFQTEEGIPDPPINLETIANQLNSIFVSWEATPLGEQNGILIGYTILYHPVLEAAASNKSNFTSSTSFLIEGLRAGESYSVSVAAHTGGGMGNFSDPLNQSTFTFPPAIPSEGFGVVERNVSATTLPVNLPGRTSSSTSAFSHFWVVIVKVNETFNSTALPDKMFVTNDSFQLYNASIGFNVPYIAAEISSDMYATINLPFVVGGGPHRLNEIDMYQNGPLVDDTLYTVFVRGFSPVPSSSSPPSRVRRQVLAPARQYEAFTSSPFLSPTRTGTIGGSGRLSGSEIAAVVIAVIIIIILAVAIVVVVIFLCERWRYTAEIGPPPSRKGSMRLRDANEVIRDPLRSGSFRVSRGGTLRSSFRAAAGLTVKNYKMEAELEDLNPEDARLPVKVSDFAGHLKKMHKNTDHLFSEEYEIIGIKSPSLPHVQCSLPANVSKNRYANINSYDNSRVALQGDMDVIGSDYINANYINGYKSKCAYIAAQGPLANTTHDFWRMVWEQDSCCIIMLTNLVEKSRTKCHQYWPEVGSMNMGDLTISLVEVQHLAYYTIRTFRVTKGPDTREIKQFHYTGWPDFGVPDYPSPVIAFIKRVERFKRTTEGPDIIHCSAGVGRTGTLIAIQCMMQMLEDESQIDVFNFVLGMRHQRNYMVQTERQYVFIHDTLLEHIRAGETEVDARDLFNHFQSMKKKAGMRHTPLELEYQNLDRLQHVDTSQYHPAQLSVNQSKNRSSNILPYDRYRVRLLLHPGVQGSDYINASYLDGYHRRHQFIVTQGPMSNTVTDFWRMVWEHRCSCILMLCPLVENGNEQSVCYWPEEKVHQHGDLFIELVSAPTKYPAYVMRELAITNTKINESRTVRHFHYEEWLEDKAPDNAADIMDLIGVLQKTQNKCGGGPIVVHDNTGIGRGGAFVVLNSVMEQLKSEGVVDPFFTIHSLRHQQPGLVTNFSQYQFCYQVLMEFLDSFDHYCNFGKTSYPT